MELIRNSSIDHGFIDSKMNNVDFYSSFLNVLSSGKVLIDQYTEEFLYIEALINFEESSQEERDMIMKFARNAVMDFRMSFYSDGSTFFSIESMTGETTSTFVENVESLWIYDIFDHPDQILSSMIAFGYSSNKKVISKFIPKSQYGLFRSYQHKFQKRVLHFLNKRCFMDPHMSITIKYFLIKHVEELPDLKVHADSIVAVEGVSKFGRYWIFTINGRFFKCESRESSETDDFLSILSNVVSLNDKYHCSIDIFL